MRMIFMDMRLTHLRNAHIVIPSKRNIDAADGTIRRASQEDRLLI